MPRPPHAALPFGGELECGFESELRRKRLIGITQHVQVVMPRPWGWFSLWPRLALASGHQELLIEQQLGYKQALAKTSSLVLTHVTPARPATPRAHLGLRVTVTERSETASGPGAAGPGGGDTGTEVTVCVSESESEAHAPS
jgi:hypothetical protein